MNTKQIIRYAVSVSGEYRDDCGEINLTALEEAVQDHFNLEYEEFEDNDIGFLIFKELERFNLL